MMINSQTTCEIEVMNTLCWSKIYGAHHTSLITLHYIDIHWYQLKKKRDLSWQHWKEKKKQCRKTFAGNVIFFSIDKI